MNPNRRNRTRSRQGPSPRAFRLPLSLSLPLPPKGFTLIEMIGVLSIMAILAGVLAPVAVRQIARASSLREDKTLETLAGALSQYILRNQQVPGTDSWAKVTASIAGQSTDQVLYARLNDSTSTRVYLVHPSFQPATGTSPVFQQTSTAVSSISDARILLISSSRVGLALPLKSSAGSKSSASIADFEAVWGWAGGNSTDSPPSGWPKEWTGRGENLHVQRINLAGAFHRITFTNLEYPTNSPSIQIAADNSATFSSASSYEGYYMEGTPIRLYKAETFTTTTSSSSDSGADSNNSGSSNSSNGSGNNNSSKDDDDDDDDKDKGKGNDKDKAGKQSASKTTSAVNSSSSSSGSSSSSASDSSSGLVPGALDMIQVVKGPINFVYANGQWRAY